MVDLSDARAAVVMQSVRQRVAPLADAGAALRRARDAARRAGEILRDGGMASAFGCAGNAVCTLARLPEEQPLWIVGDVRGDVIALASALAFIDEADRAHAPAAIAFLGDWTGGTAGDAACAALVLERFVAEPERTLLMRGDREWAAPLPFDMPSGIRTMPRTTAVEPLHAEACEAIEAVAARLPALALLPDELVLAHGSLPRPSRLRAVKSLEDLAGSDAALRDCVMGRQHLREMRIEAGEREGGLILGVEDFENALRTLNQLSGRPISRMVRGQDAAPEGFRWFKAYGPGVLLTLTTMADELPESAGGGRRCPCVGRFKSGVIRVVRMMVPTDVAQLGDQLFPRRDRDPAHVASPARAPMPEARPDHLASPTSKASDVPAQATGNSVMASKAATLTAHPPPSRDPDPASVARAGPEAARMLFDRGVRLLQARAWAGARDAFRTAGAEPSMHEACALNEAVACMWMGPSGHQDALARLRTLRQLHPRDPAVLLNMGIAFLVCERNPSEAMRALRAAVDASADMTDAWWALGLAAAMRSDASTAASAFNVAADGGCALPVPGSLHGLIPARELGPVLEALRGLARHKPRPEAPPVAMHG
jgi:hypothetical protein